MKKKDPLRKIGESGVSGAVRKRNKDQDRCGELKDQGRKESKLVER